MRSGDSRDQPELLANLHGLRPSPCAQLVEQAAGVRLHRIFAHEDPLGDFAIAQAVRDELEDLQLTPRDAQRFEPLDVEDEGGGCGDGDLPHDDGFLRARQRQTEANAERILRLIETGELMVKPLCSHVNAPADLNDAYQGLLHRKDEYVGVVLDWEANTPPLPDWSRAN